MPRKSWLETEGAPYPLGATWIPSEEAFNFAIYSKHATSVTLLFFNDQSLDQPLVVKPLDHLVHKSGRIWHCRLPESEILGARYYAYQIDGPDSGQGFDLHAFDRDKLLLDPYAKQVFFPEAFDRQAAMRPGSNLGRAPLGVLSKNGYSFDWGKEHVPFHEHDLVIYELHVRGFTRHPNSGVAPERRGTYLGVIDKIPYLRDLGVTAVELMPVFQFDPQEGNCWGYMPINFFAPHSPYASQPVKAANEFRTMVKALHAAGIEVLLDVVFNHTGEGNQWGPCYSLKGIDNSSYYLVTGDPEDPYYNYSGTGNTLHTQNRHTSRMILESMRSWVQQYHVDGFRFDLASIFNRRIDGTVSTDESRLVAAIRADPVLGNKRLIAEPWDAGGLHQLGRSFPGKRWFQWNGRFRDDIRQFVKGDRGMVSRVMTRLYGSDDLFPDTLMEACHPYQSVNFVNSHDGFTLYDQVAYNERNNWANGEDNEDGHRDNHSWNCGWEGDVGVPAEVMQLRVQQAKNFACLLMLSNGTAMFRAGDEFLQTQKGNNNPYNQDNETSWLDWSRLKTFAGFHRFFRELIAFRQNHPSISRSRFWRDEVKWYGQSGKVDWSDTSRHLAYFLDGRSQQDDDLYVMLNAEAETIEFVIQEWDQRIWKRVVDTSRPSPDDFQNPENAQPLQSRRLKLAPRSTVVLVRSR